MLRSSRYPASSRLKSRFRNADEENLLHKRLTIKHIFTLKDRFEHIQGRRMTRKAFRKCLFDVARIYFTDEEYNQLCAKLNFTRTSTDIFWLEVLGHLGMEIDSEQTHKLSSKLELPVTGAAKEIKSHHRLPIMRITFVPEMQQNRKINHLYGIYVTCSRDGNINYWSIDMEKERTVYSKSPELKSQQTWILDLVSLPDFNVICTSSTERDLRFYDTTAKKFELRVMITSMENMVTAMHYCFYADKEIDSKLVFGNSAGKVKLIKIKTKDRGPFQSLSKKPLTSVTYEQFAKGHIKTMEMVDIGTTHTEWVHQVAYFQDISCIISVSTCSTQSMYIANPNTQETFYTFKVSQGISCFAFEENVHMIATGGPDCLVRVWNPLVPSRPISVFHGHHLGIVSITLQDEFKILISLDKNKCVKIWDVSEQVCIQNYLGLPASLGERTPLCTYYNPVSRQLFVASKKIAYFKVYPLLNGEYTDGVSHSKEVSVILFNQLFNVLISCGFDSFIIVWNPWNGKRTKFVRNAHQQSINGEIVPVEITAAALDPSQQFLITGASDGTLKIWTCSIMSCTRNMSIQRKCEVYSIIWIKYRILVMGENRVVTEFADGDDIGSSNYKSWMKRHDEDILCAAAYLPQTLVTASYSGEIIFWRMETGQSYGIFNVNNPTERIQVQYSKKPITEIKDKDIRSIVDSIQIKRHSGKKSQPIPIGQSVTSSKFSVASSVFTVGKLKSDRNLSDIKDTLQTRAISVNVLLSLTTRISHPQTGTIFAALDNGQIQVWSHHPAGGYLTEFKATHSKTDYVVSMCTDKENDYLFTGHMTGYIKIWHMINYCMQEEFQVHINMPKLRLKFPFLWRDRILGRAKRAHKENDNIPLLVNSYKAHLKAVTGLIFMTRIDVLISCSSDNSIRIWTLNGKYMGTLGTFKPWTHISSTEKPDAYNTYNMPADIRRCASFTTAKVMANQTLHAFFANQPNKDEYDLIVNRKKVYGERVDLNSILGKHFRIKPKGIHHYDIMLNTTLHEIPIFSELTLHEPELIELPPTPDLIKKIHKQQAPAKKH